MLGKTACLLLLFAATIANAGDLVDVPLRKVVLFNSGLGYFEHARQVDGTVDVELEFDTTDINDLLKSLVVQDMGGGIISAVRFPSRSPLNEQLRRFSMDLTTHPTLGELLHQLRGEEIVLDGETTGTIIGVELKPQTTGQQVTNREVLNLLTERGLRGIPLDLVGDISLVNDRLNTELRDALKLLVAGRRTDTKTVQFTCAGDGKRMVRLGYIRATPIWKTSYRVVLKDGEMALLQGWAILENTCESDWDNVALTLTSGRPVTFQMDLYRPLFVQRQEIMPSVPPSLALRVYSPALDELDMDEPLATSLPLTNQQPPYVRSRFLAPGAGMGGMGGMGGGGFGGGGAGGAGNGGGTVAGGPFGAAEGEAEDWDASQGVVAQASAADIGEQFQYKIAVPVTLASRRSAMIPIIDQDIKAEKLSVFSAADDSAHPMLAFRLTNTTDLRLTGGPVTVFDDGVYAGDARIEYIRPHDKRLVSYAQDVDVTLRYALEKETRTLRRAWLDLGVVRLAFELGREHRYRVQSKSNDDRQLVIEQPRDGNDWALEDRKQPAEKTDDMYRFELVVPANETVELIVAEQSKDEQQYDLKAVELKTLEGLSRREDLPDDVLKTIRQVRQLRVGIADQEARLKVQQQLLSDIKDEQSRIRSNMSALGHDSDLYRRYVTKLTAQEDHFDKQLGAIAQTRVRYTEMRRELAKFFPSSADDEAGADPFEVGDPFGTGEESGADPFGK